MRRPRLTVSHSAAVILAVAWGLIALFVLADLSEDARGDSYLLRAIPWDLLAGAVVTVLIVGIDRLLRSIRSGVRLE